MNTDEFRVFYPFEADDGLLRLEEGVDLYLHGGGFFVGGAVHFGLDVGAGDYVAEVHREVVGALGVGLWEDLGGGLTEVYDLALDGFAVFGVREGLEIHGVLVGEVEEYVECFDCLLPSLLIPIHQINPVIDILTNHIHLKCLPQLRHIQIRIIPGPLGQLHIMHPPLILHNPQIIFLLIEEHLRQRKELRYQFPHIRIFTRTVTVGVFDGEEQTVGEVEAAALQADGALGVGGDSHHVVVDDAGARVVRAVVEFLAVYVRVQVVVTLLEGLHALDGAQAAHVLGEVAVAVGAGEVQFLGEGGDCPGEYVVLGYVFVAPARQTVYLHQILEVGHLEVRPFFNK